MTLYIKSPLFEIPKMNSFLLGPYNAISTLLGDTFQTLVKRKNILVIIYYCFCLIH